MGNITGKKRGPKPLAEKEKKVVIRIWVPKKFETLAKAKAYEIEKEMNS
jgi:hypothetical protein